jgi:uncharacterized protein involved in type VI secretion and phage assembly
MNLAQIVMRDGQRTPADASGRIYGVAVGVVTDNKDPDGLGRVKVQFPWLASDAESAWARMATLMAGNDRGSFYLPEVNDEVLVAFEHGDLRYPYVIGALWNGKDKPPETNADGKNNKRLIKSRSGMTILLDDTSGSEKVVIADKDGQNKIVVEMTGKKITITSNGDVEVSAPQGTLTLSGQTVKIESSGETSIKATGVLNAQGQTVNVKGQPMVNIN